ncbi:hypothetical protein AB0K51_29395 [Kitasatospora sp. NPDC049285]|uniref:hypothetical protein n=1 Tax=Kitasatospora sp. NPDC049285 TaxID=3157096 RepID=UPI003442F3AE
MKAYLAAVLVWALGAAVVFLPLGGPGVQPAGAASGVTVDGPEAWDPNTWTYGPKGSVTVSPAAGLGNQTVHVSWTGFTPSVDDTGQPAAIVANPLDGSPDKVVRYPVRVYQCRGTNPAITDCYGSSLYGGDPAKGFLQKAPAAGLSTPEFPSNMVIVPTRADGTGEADIEVWSAQQSQSLDCDPTHPCSIVVEPNYGGDPLGAYTFPDSQINCDDHSADSDGLFNTATDATLYTNMYRTDTVEYRSGEACAWQHHVAVPLTFGPTAGACDARSSDFSAIGLEMADRAVQQWRTGLCLASEPLNVQYTAGGGEPQARSSFLRGSGADIALTALPDRNAPARPYVYAPLASSAISVVFLIDDGTTHRQVRRVRLNERLLAKMLTQTYRNTADDSMDTVKGNPVCIFTDQEFLKLNADVAAGVGWPSCINNGFASSVPVVVGGTTDLVHQLTEWIAANPDAAQFLQGATDPWGTHLNTNYLPSKFPGYPADAFQPQDFSGPRQLKQYEWNPVLGGLGQVLRMAMQPRASCLNPDEVQGQHARCLAQTIGLRSFFAITDSGDAQAVSLPEAELPNAAGQFTTPTIGSMQAAVADMPLDATTGTQQLPYQDRDSAYAKDTKAYPLTMMQYAMVPTGGVAKAKADAIAGFLRTVTDPGKGQVYGRQPGQLAIGYAGLTKQQLARAKAAADHVAAQDGAKPNGQDPGSGNGNGNGSGGTTGGSAGTAGGGNSATGGSGSNDGSYLGGTGGSGGTGSTTGAAAATGTGTGGNSTKPSGSSSPTLGAAVVGQAAPDRAGMARLLLPVILATGAVLLVGGPAALFLGGTAAGANIRRGTGRFWSRLLGRNG